MAKNQTPKSTATASTVAEMQDLPELPEEYRGMSLQQIQLAIAAADLQAKLLDLDRIRDENAKRLAVKQANDNHNKQIQEQIKSEEAMLRFAQSVCRHRMGGYAKNIWAGDGRPCVVRTQMLDGVTYLLQCLRCRLKVLTPHPSLAQKNPAQYQAEMALYQKLWEMSADSGLDEIRGPTFVFKQDGVPIIPERV